MTPIDLDGEISKLERQWMSEALLFTGNCKKKAAKLLSISFRSFRYRFAKHFGRPEHEPKV